MQHDRHTSPETAERAVGAPRLRPDLPPLPPRMRALPVDARGYPVPWFVAWFDGKPDFRVIRPSGAPLAIKRNTCWLCGQPLGVRKVFCIGPMCVLNRVTSEPPSHLDCAEFATQVCPFMTRPLSRRSSVPMPEDARAPVGVHLERNPGVFCLWTTRSFRPFRLDRDLPASDGFLIRIGDPDAVAWFAEGRPATAEEISHAVDTGIAETMRRDARAGRDLIEQRARLARYLPEAVQTDTPTT